MLIFCNRRVLLYCPDIIGKYKRSQCPGCEFRSYHKSGGNAIDGGSGGAGWCWQITENI